MAKHWFTSLYWHFGEFGPQDVHVHSCIQGGSHDTDHAVCARVLLGYGRTCTGGSKDHVRATLGNQASIDRALAKMRPKPMPTELRYWRCPECGHIWTEQLHRGEGLDAVWCLGFGGATRVAYRDRTPGNHDPGHWVPMEPMPIEERYWVLHAPGWPGGIQPNPALEAGSAALAAQRFVEQHGGEAHRFFITPDDQRTRMPWAKREEQGDD